jgi:hypothetical protein
MTLTIQKLHTHCRSPKSVEGASALVDDVARGLLASELTAQLGPSLDCLPAVVRVRGLRVEVKIPAKGVNTNTLAYHWARAFSLALHLALAYPDGDGASAIRRYQSQAEYNAALLQYLLTEGTSPAWQFPELDEWRGKTATLASHEFLLREPAHIGDTVAYLARSGWLEPMLALWDELQMEQLIQAIARTEATEPGMTLASLIELGQAAAASGGLHPQWTMASRRQAVRLWSLLARRFQLRAVWHGLRLLVRFLEQPASLAPADVSVLPRSTPFPQWCEAVVKEAALLDESPGRVVLVSPHTPMGSAALSSVLDDLRPLVPSAANPGQRARWITSDACSVLLLLSVIRRLGLWRLVDEPELVKFGGPRAVSFLLVATGMTLLGEWDPSGAVDPAVTLLAGIFTEVDRGGLTQFFTESDPHRIAELAGETWPETWEKLAIELARSFAERVRGFRQASRAAVVKQFIRMPGRVLVEERRMVVKLEPSPWSVALHISGMDESLESVEWLGGRRVDFVLEGL